jgi:hypothetical protein
MALHEVFLNDKYILFGGLNYIRETMHDYKIYIEFNHPFPQF